MNTNDLIKFLSDESYQSVSGVTIECNHFLGYETTYRVISKNKVGPHKESVLDAIKAYQEKEE